MTTAARTTTDAARAPPILIDTPTLTQILQVERHTLNTWVRKGILPPPVFFTGRCKRWDAAAIVDALHRRADEQAAAASAIVESLGRRAAEQANAVKRRTEAIAASVAAASSAS